MWGPLIRAMLCILHVLTFLYKVAGSANKEEIVVEVDVAGNVRTGLDARYALFFARATVSWCSWVAGRGAP